MAETDLQFICEQGQRELMEMNYLAAAATLERGEEIAWATRDWDTLSRLYMPLQEAHRQRRQVCAEGMVCLDLLAEFAKDQVSPQRILDHYPQGQLLVAGWQSIAPAQGVRRLAAERNIFVETFLAAAYPMAEGRLVVIVPTDEVALPTEVPASIDALVSKLPIGSIVLSETELPHGARRGDTQTFAQTMAFWERLHLPFLAQADSQRDPIKKMEGYRKTIRVDYACELAHQKLADVAHELARS